MSNDVDTPQNEAVLVVAAHPDDEVLGCGGTLARLASEGRQVHVLLMADGETSRSSHSQSPAGSDRVAGRRVAAQVACKTLGVTSLQMLTLPDNRMDSLDLLDVVQQIETVVHRLRPSLLLTHHAGDVNVDHRIVHDAVLAASRPQPACFVRTLMFFEVPSSTEWRPPGSAALFQPNWFVDISTTISLKLRALNAYEHELRPFPHPRSIEAIESLAKWRGASVGVMAAEAFMLGRNVV